MAIRNIEGVRKLIAKYPAVDPEIDLEGDNGFLLVLLDGYNWDANDPGCHSRGWDWHDTPNLKDIQDALDIIVACDGSCGATGCQVSNDKPQTNFYQRDDGGRAIYFPKKSHNGDCVIRACAIASGRDYKDTITELFRIGLELGDLPNGTPVYEAFLAAEGFVKQKPPKSGKGKKIPIRDWVPTAPKGRIVALTRRHLIAIVDNVQRDIWLDERCVNTYWHKGV